MNQYVNLLPAAWQRRSALRAALRRWAPIWLIGVIALAAASGLAWRRANVEIERHAALLREQKRAETLGQKLTAARRRLAELEAQTAADRPFVEQVPGVAVFAVVSRAAQQLGGEVQVQQLDFQTVPSTATPPGTAQRTLTLEGEALAAASIARLAAALRETEALGAVDVKSAVVEQSGGPQHYRIQCVW